MGWRRGHESAVARRFARRHSSASATPKETASAGTLGGSVPTAGSTARTRRALVGAAHDELNLIALTHNLLKLSRFGVRPALTLAA